VVHKGWPVGIITERDVLERVLGRNLNGYQTRVKNVMSTPPVSIASDRPIKKALDFMRQQNIRRLAVTENDTLVGLVTERRLLTGFLSQIYGTYERTHRMCNLTLRSS
jgi:CBS domain-containing protein